MMTEEQKHARIESLTFRLKTLDLLEEDGIHIDVVERDSYRIALAALTQPASPALKLPDGWRLMPDEPTEEMMRAMYQAQDMWPSAHCDNMRETQMSFARPRYIAALATAPKAPSVQHTAPIEPICATGGAEWIKAVPRELQQVLLELRTYNPKADEHGGKHIIPGWADRIEKALGIKPAAPEE